MKKCFIIVSIIFLFFVCFAPIQSFAAVTKFGKLGLDQTAGQITDSGLKKTNIPIMIGKALGVLLYTVAVIFFILMVYAGILWMTARGKEDQAKKAQSTIIAASVGLIIVLSSYSLTNFLFSSLEGESENEGDKGCCVLIPKDKEKGIFLIESLFTQKECDDAFNSARGQNTDYFANTFYPTNNAEQCSPQNEDIKALTELLVPGLCPNTEVKAQPDGTFSTWDACIGKNVGEACSNKGWVGNCELTDDKETCICQELREPN